MKKKIQLIYILLLFLVSACGGRVLKTQTVISSQQLKVLAVVSFLSDITQHVAGDRVTIDTLIPPGLDPHAYEPAPKDLAKIASSAVVIVNGAGLEGWLSDALAKADGNGIIIEASKGLKGRPLDQDQIIDGKDMDPHFWLDPNLVIQYVLNIRDGLIEADPAGAEIYNRNADAYIADLKELDQWIRAEVEKIPPSRRILITNHESFGYFADRYGFKVIGTIIPSVSTDSSPSAQHLASLIDTIKGSGAVAIFLETGTNPQLAEQIARETGIKVIYGLSSHSLPPGDSAVNSYIGLMQYNVRAIVDALQ